MVPIYGIPNYNFMQGDDTNGVTETYDTDQNQGSDRDASNTSLTEMTFWYMIVLVSMLLIWLILFFCLRIISLRQKTRLPQRRMNTDSRTRTSLSQGESTVYISPANYPPPPKYEAMAPPSYEEVVGVHYPNYQPPAAMQPITQPITTAIAQSSSNGTSTSQNNENATKINITNEATATPSTVITVTTDERRQSQSVCTVRTS